MSLYKRILPASIGLSVLLAVVLAGMLFAPLVSAQGSGGTVTGTVALQGAPTHGGVTVQIGAQSTTSNADGTFTITDIPAEIYTLTADADGYLMGRVTGLHVTDGSAEDVGLVVLRAGDVNDDGVVDTSDLNALAAELGNSPPLNPVVDYTRDNLVNVRDLVLLSRNRGKQELGGAVVDTADIGGVTIDQDTGDPIAGVSVTAQVDIDGDGEYAPIGQEIAVSGFDEFFAETYRAETDAQGVFTFESLPFLKDTVALDILMEFQRDGYATFTQNQTFYR